MKMRNVRKIIINHDPERYTGQVGAAQISNGEVLVVFNECRERRHDDSDSIIMLRSSDNGESFPTSKRQVIYPYSHHFGTDTPSIVQLSDGSLVVNFVMSAQKFSRGITEDFGAQSEGGYQHMWDKDGVWLTRSFDLGKTWDPVYKADIAPLRYGQPIDEVLELPSGSLLMACSGKKDRRNLESTETRRSFVIRSDNKGLDWEYLGTIAYDPANITAFWEPTITRTSNGTIVSMLRAVAEPRLRQDNMWVAYSTDEGFSWSRPERTPLWGYPADLICLHDGRILATYGHRRDPYCIRGCLSGDGIHWNKADEFTIGLTPVPPKSVSPWWHIGYPTSIQLKNGTIFSIYHEWSTQEPWVQVVAATLWELGD
jgi:hypothetical protein